MSEVQMVASFADEEQCVHTIERLREAQVRPRVFSPIPSEKITEALYEGRSSVRNWVLSGGIFGALSGFALTLGTSYEWNLIAGGKPIASIPAYLIIVFELMILCGGIAGVMGFFFTSKMPVFEPLAGYNNHFSGDRFGLVVDCDEAESGRLETLLKEGGADEVEVTRQPL
jgi:Alternative complex III, ActD subunit